MQKSIFLESGPRSVHKSRMESPGPTSQLVNYVIGKLEISEKELGEKLDSNQGNVNRWRRGENEAGFDKICKMLQLVSIDWKHVFEPSDSQLRAENTQLRQTNQQLRTAMRRLARELNDVASNPYYSFFTSSEVAFKP